MIVIVTGLIALDDSHCDRINSSLTAAHYFHEVMWEESSQWLGKNVV